MTRDPPCDPLPVDAPLDRRWIERHIPHQGRMCLLDAVIAWDLGQIRCRASSQRLADNPLRAHGRLGAICAVEYAGQAMAVHGAIVASLTGTRAPPGYLASVRNLLLRVARLDDLTEDLLVSARRVAGDEASALYEFALSAGERTLVTGRASIVFGTLAAAHTPGTRA